MAGNKSKAATPRGAARLGAVLVLLLAMLLGGAAYLSSTSTDNVDWRVKFIIHPLAKMTYYLCGMSTGQSFNRGLFNALVNKFQQTFESLLVHDVHIEDHDVPRSFCSAHTESSKAFTASDVPIRIWAPVNATGKLPVLVWMHGGGFVIGSGRDAATDRFAKTFVRHGPFIVVSIDYRLAPEFPFPHGLEDSYCVLSWLNSPDARALPILSHLDIDKIIVAGESAGANYATVATIMARDRAAPFKIAHQILIYPGLFRVPLTGSAVLYENAYILPRAVKKWFAEQYVSDEALLQHRYVSPFKAQLEGLPSAQVIGAEYDPLRDEGLEYYNALTAAGVTTRYKCFNGTVHGFMSFAFLPVAHEALLDVIYHAQKTLGSAT